MKKTQMNTAITVVIVVLVIFLFMLLYIGLSGGGQDLLDNLEGILGGM